MSPLPRPHNKFNNSNIQSLEVEKSWVLATEVKKKGLFSRHVARNKNTHTAICL